MNQSELKQIQIATNMFSRDPERLKDIFISGKLRLCSEAMYVLYLHYLSGKDFKQMSNSNTFPCSLNIGVSLTENERYIAKLFSEKK